MNHVTHYIQPEGRKVAGPSSTMGMSEDEFVVLVEHAGLLETSEDAAMEFLAKAQLLDWLSREGLAFFTEQFLQHGEEPTAADEAAARKDAMGDADTLADDQRRALAARVLERLLEREWIAPVDEQEIAEEEEVPLCTELHVWSVCLTLSLFVAGDYAGQDTCYAIRLPTTEAYKIYMEKDPEVRWLPIVRSCQPKALTRCDPLSRTQR